MKKLTIYFITILLVSACASNPTPPLNQITFLDTNTFDEELSKSTFGGVEKITVSMLGPLTLNIPSSLAIELKTANQAFLINILERGLNDFKIERALKQYSRGNMSFGAAAEQANVSQSMLSKYAYARGIEPSFSVETVDEYLLILINGLESLSKTSQFVILSTIGETYRKDLDQSST